MSRSTVDVVVPTFRRPLLLEACLRGLAEQSRPADRVLVVIRRGDLESHAVVDGFDDLPGLEVVDVDEPGVIAAMSAGVARSSGSVIAFTDDDAVPRPDWVGRLVDAFGDAAVGAVGGRDVLPGTDGPLSGEVGTFTRSWRLVGNHHLGTGPARDVHVLKGVNMAFRAEALVLPAPGVLRGGGAQPHHEVLTCEQVRTGGWRVIYDPDIQVDHFAAPRVGLDQRVRPHRQAIFDSSYNFTMAVGAPDRVAVLRLLLASLLWGDADRPGAVRAAGALVRRERSVLRRVVPSVLGITAACAVLLVRPGRRRVTSAESLRRAARSGLDGRPRVALVAHAVHDGGGMERACAELIRRTSDRFAYTVVAREVAPDLLPHIERWVPVRVPGRPASLRFPSFYAVAGVVVARLAVDVVHTVGAIIPNRVDVAAVHYCHAGALAASGLHARDSAPIHRRANRRLVRAMAIAAERWTYRPGRARTLTAVSTDAAREVATHYPGLPVRLVPNGVDLKRFRPDDQVRDEVRSAHGVGPDEVVVLFVGGDWERKRLDLVIDALAEVRSEGGTRLWVVGRGDERRFGDRAAAAGVADAVWFAGHRDDPERFFQAADIFVLPSSYETFSLVAFEAAASGLPLILTSVHGARELIRGSEAGFETAPDVPAIADALRALVQDPVLRARMGRAAREAVRGFGWDQSAESMVDVYRSGLPA